MAMNGLCQSPFLQEDLFHPTGGFVDGRYCQTLPINGSSISCCLPCPLADWRYADDVAKKADIAGWISVAILPLCVFLLISYAVLPVKWTNRHYLSICFTLGICCMEIAFIIPLGVKPNQCHNAITPNDMYSNLSCAFSGSFLLFGGWVVVIWSFIRTLAFHLQVCWEIVLGPKFKWGAFVCGFGIPAIGLTVMLIFTGVSFRFGDTCHINIAHSTQDYWAPIMAFAAAALVLQLATMVYCTHIYLRSLFDKSVSTVDNNTGRPSYTSSVRSATARQAYHRVRRVLQLQWRGGTLVMIIIANVIFFAVVFTRMDRQVEPTAANMDKAKPWLMCLTIRSKQECRQFASDLGPNEATILAVVYLLSLVGLWNFLLFARPSMFAGWLDLCRRTFARRNESVPADVPGRYADHKGFEMLTATVKVPETFMRSPSPASPSPSPSPSPTLDRSVHFGQEARYHRPSMSFSGPRPPGSLPAGREGDPASTFAKGNAR